MKDVIWESVQTFLTLILAITIIYTAIRFIAKNKDDIAELNTRVDYLEFKVETQNQLIKELNNKVEQLDVEVKQLRCEMDSVNRDLLNMF